MWLTVTAKCALYCPKFTPKYYLYSVLLSPGAEKPDTQVCSRNFVCQLQQCDKPDYRCLQCKFHFMNWYISYFFYL